MALSRAATSVEVLDSCTTRRIGVSRSTFLDSGSQVGVAPLQLVKVRVAKSFNGGIKMSLFQHFSKAVQSFAEKLLRKFEDSKLIHECTVIEITEDLETMTKLQVKAFVFQKKLEKEYDALLQVSEQWRHRARLARRGGDEDLAVAAWKESQSYLDDASVLKKKIDEQKAVVDFINKNRQLLAIKLREAKSNKNLLQARAEAERIIENVRERWFEKDEEED